jgi:predicted dehydrogenase
MTVRIGFISFAHGHAGVYAGELRKMPEVELVACWDDDAERGTEAAQTYGMRFDADLDDLLGDGSIDTVIIGSPTNRHADHAVAAVGAGKNILLQKPMALSLPDCDRIIDAVNESDILFSMAYQMRCDPVNREMRRMVHNGDLGRIGIARRRHCIPVLFNEGFVTGKTRWHVDPVQNMGMWMDDASHAADWFYWMFGRPRSVIAEVGNILTHAAPDDTGVAIYRFPESNHVASGMMGILFNGSAIHAGMNTTELYGDEGVLTQNFGDSPSTGMEWPEGARPVHWMRADQGDQKWRAPDLPIQAQGDRIAQVPRPFVNALTEGSPVIASAEEGRVAVEMILTAYESARDGVRVSLID